jgi:hypothetical protein
METATPATDPIEAPATTTAELVSALKALAPKRKVTIGELKVKTPFNQTGKRRSFKVPVFTNGYEEDIDTTKDDELKLYEQLKPGKYIDGLVTVEFREVRGEGGERRKELLISYPDATKNDRMNTQREWRERADMLRKCIREAGDKPLA